jgi:thiopurine S-methyltransferase
VYDRASLIALPLEMREHYAAKMHDLLPFHTVILLVALYYPQHEMQGPPFCVGITEVNNLFANWCGVEHLYIEDITDKEPHFKAKGLSQIHEEVYRITIKNRD